MSGDFMKVGGLGFMVVLSLALEGCFNSQFVPLESFQAISQFQSVGSLAPGADNGAFKGIMWGVNGHPGRAGNSTYADPAAQMKLVHSLGMKHYRADFYNADETQFSRLQKLLDAAKPYGIVVTPILIQNAGTTEPDSYTRGYNLAKGYAQRFPDILVFEIGNEENNELRDGFQDGSLPSVWTALEGYPNIRGRLRGQLEGLKAGNPKVLSAFGDAGGCNYGFMQALHADGLRWDITVFHPYDFWGDIENRGSTGVHCQGGDNMLQKHADFGKPIWLTEFNWTPSVNDADKTGEGKGLVSMMTKFNSLAKKYNIQAADIYELVDEPDLQDAERFFGVFGDGGAETPAAEAVRAYLKDHPSAVYP
jgi:hypothetical protein